MEFNGKEIELLIEGTRILSQHLAEPPGIFDVLTGRITDEIRQKALAIIYERQESIVMLQAKLMQMRSTCRVEGIIEAVPPLQAPPVT